MTYQNYLELWEERFEGCDQGRFYYWVRNQEQFKILPRMTEEQFNHALAKINDLGPQINELQRRPDYWKNETLNKQVDKLLAESFEYELALFY